MSKKRSIYFPDTVLEYLSDAEVLSSRVAGIILRYQEIAARELPELSRGEWCAVCDANNGCDDLLMGDHPHSIGLMLWANVADSHGLGEKWQIDQDALVQTMRGWSYTQQCAAFEAVRRFWRLHELDTDEALKLAGMVREEQTENP